MRSCAAHLIGLDDPLAAEGLVRDLEPLSSARRSGSSLPGAERGVVGDKRGAVAYSIHAGLGPGGRGAVQGVLGALGRVVNAVACARLGLCSSGQNQGAQNLSQDLNGGFQNIFLHRAGGEIGGAILSPR